MTIKELERQIDLTLKECCTKFGLTDNHGGTNSETTEELIRAVSRSQLRTMGVYNNRFEISFGASLSVLKVENIWQDLKSLIRPTPTDIKDQEFIEKQIPRTISIRYNKDEVSKMFPNNTRDTGWLHFDISLTGINELKNVLNSIIEEQLLPKLEKYQSIEILDNIVNEKITLCDLEKHPFIIKEFILIKRIILAKLNNNPLFEKICESERKNFNDYVKLGREVGYEYYGNIPEVFETVYKRLNK